MDPEKREAIREGIRPYRGLMRYGCGVSLGLLLFFCLSGHWLWLGVVAVVSLIAMMMGGMAIGALGPADDTQRTAFEASLMVGLLGDKQKSWIPRIVRLILSPTGWFIGSYGGASAYVRAARKGTKGRDWLLRQLRSEDAFDRWRALKTFERLGMNECAEPLAEYLSDGDTRVREAAAAVLGTLESKESLKELNRNASETDDDVAWLATVSALCLKGEKPEIDMARVIRAANLIRSEGTLDRMRLAPMVSALPSVLVVDILREEMEAASRWDPTVLRNLARQRTDPGRQLLREALNSESEPNRRMALISLLEFPDTAFEPELVAISELGERLDKLTAQEILTKIRAVPEP